MKKKIQIQGKWQKTNIFREHLQRAVVDICDIQDSRNEPSKFQKTCDHGDTNYISDNWEQQYYEHSINSDKGQYSQFLRCLVLYFLVFMHLEVYLYLHLLWCESERRMRWLPNLLLTHFLLQLHLATSPSTCTCPAFRFANFVSFSCFNLYF